MEQSLGALIRTNTLPRETIPRIIDDIFAAVANLHAQGQVDHALTPERVLVYEEPEDLDLDLGLELGRVQKCARRILLSCARAAS